MVTVSQCQGHGSAWHRTQARLAWRASWPWLVVSVLWLLWQPPTLGNVPEPRKHP